METLEEEMYCYVKNFREYGIGIINCILDNNLCVIDCQHNAHTVSCDNVIASHNIINLIEVGDVVMINVLEDDFNWNKGKWIFHLYDTQIYYEFLNSLCDNVKIIGILTHEQFENNCFRIGD